MTEEGVTPIPPTAIKDKVLAEEAAYGEKPLRDYEIEYRKQLTDEGRAALLQIAAAEGEKAMHAYQETQSLVDPRIDALKALVASSVQIVPELAARFKGKGFEEQAGQVETLLRRIAQGRLEQVLVDGSDFDLKKSTLSYLGPCLVRGAGMALGGETAAFQVVSSERATNQPADAIIDTMYGYFATKILTGRASAATDALFEIAKLEGRTFVEMVQEHLPILVDLRSRYPLVNKEIGVGPSGQKQLALDSTLADRGFLWSPARSTFVHMRGPGPEAVKPLPPIK